MACELNRTVVSLAGPSTALLEELNLLEDVNLKAISNFNLISKKTSADILAGGIFMAQKVFKKYSQAVFIIDKSRELERTFKTAGHENYKVLDTIGEDSYRSFELTKELLIPFLKNCDKELAKLDRRFALLKEKLKKFEKKKMIFFLGELKQKLPQLIISRDGFVLSLIKYGRLSTYKSELAYIPWSEKELAKYSDFLYIGVSTHKKENLLSEKESDNKFNIYHPGVLTPGLGQLLFLEEFVSLSFH